MTLDEIVADDRSWFERHSDREFRLRRAHRCEFKFKGEPPAGMAAFVIVDRYEIDEPWRHRQFGAAFDLNVEWSDTTIKRFIVDAGAGIYV